MPLPYFLVRIIFEYRFFSIYTREIGNRESGQWRGAYRSVNTQTQLCWAAKNFFVLLTSNICWYVGGLYDDLIVSNKKSQNCEAFRQFMAGSLLNRQGQKHVKTRTYQFWINVRWFNSLDKEPGTLGSRRPVVDQNDRETVDERDWFYCMRDLFTEI